MVLGLVLGAVKEVVQGLVHGVVEDVLLEFNTNIGLDMIEKRLEVSEKQITEIYDKS